MPQVKVKGFRFHADSQLDLYRKEKKEKGMFEFPKVVATFEASDDKIILPILEELASVQLKGTFLKAYKKNDDGCWDYCAEREGKVKGNWGDQSADAKASGAQEAEPIHAVN